MFVYAFSVIDMQIMHGALLHARLAFQRNPARYIDIGFDVPQSAAEESFTVGGLIAACR